MGIDHSHQRTVQPHLNNPPRTGQYRIPSSYAPQTVRCCKFHCTSSHLGGAAFRSCHTESHRKCCIQTRLHIPSARRSKRSEKCSYISLCREINDSPPQAVRRHLHILSRYEANFTHLFILLAVNSGFSPDEQVRIFYNSSTNLQPNLECCPQKYKTTHISTTLHPFQSHDMAAQRRQSSLWERISYVSVSVQTE